MGTGTTAERGYGSEHRRARRAALAALQDGDPCARCRGPMWHGQDLHLDHNDDRTGYLGLSHAQCNRIDGAQRGGNQRRGGRRAWTPRPAWHSRAW